MGGSIHAEQPETRRQLLLAILFISLFFVFYTFSSLVYGLELKGTWDGVSMMDTWDACVGCTVFRDIAWKHSFLKRLGRWGWLTTV